jgi:hypothetical protein
VIITDALLKVWNNRELVEWEDGRIWVVSKEGLIALKTISGREQDLRDINKLQEVDDES